MGLNKRERAKIKEEKIKRKRIDRKREKRKYIKEIEKYISGNYDK